MSGLAKAFEEGGWAMYVILFWLVLAIGFIVERAVYLYRASINKDVFLATMQKCILAGDIGRAIKLCSAANAPLARIVKAGLMKVNRPDAEVQAAMDESALRELPKIEARTPFLGLFANLAMLSGLFGTVLGHELHGVRPDLGHRRAHGHGRLERQDAGPPGRHQRRDGSGHEPRREQPLQGQPPGPSAGVNSVFPSTQQQEI